MVSARPARCLARTWHSPSVDMNPDSLTAKPALLFPQIGGAAALPYRPLKEGPVQLGETFWSLAPEEGRRWGSKAGDSTPSLQVTPLSPFPQGPALNSPPTPNSHAVCLQKCMCWDFPGGLLVKTLPSNAGNVGSIPGWGAKAPQASRPNN